MKTKKLLSLLFVFASLLLLLAACGTKEKEEPPKETEPAINPELIAVFGEDFMNSKKENISDLVSDLEDCYKQYQKDKDLRTFLVNVGNTVSEHNFSDLNIHNELLSMRDNETDAERKEKLESIFKKCRAFFMDGTAWSSYKNSVDLGLTTTLTEEEVEEYLISYINGISEFFYCKPITK